jgi:hypothetical protein
MSFDGNAKRNGVYQSSSLRTRRGFERILVKAEHLVTGFMTSDHLCLGNCSHVSNVGTPAWRRATLIALHMSDFTTNLHASCKLVKFETSHDLNASECLMSFAEVWIGMHVIRLRCGTPGSGGLLTWAPTLSDMYTEWCRYNALTKLN